MVDGFPGFAACSPRRREFLRGLLSACALTSVASNGAEASGRATPEAIARREQYLDQLIAIQSEGARSQSVRDALEGKGDHQLRRILRPLQGQIHPAELTGTKYDTSVERVRYCTQIANRQTPHGGRTYWLTSGRANERPFSRRHENAYGNGVYFQSIDRYLTCRHVHDQLDGKPHVQSGKYDLKLYSMPQNQLGRPEQVLHLDSALSDEHIHGGFVTVEGIDPDASARPDGYKTYPSIALKMGRGLIELMYGHTDPGSVDRLANSFMIALPPGEAAGGTPFDRLGTGMSGAPVFLHQHGVKRFVGIMHAIGLVRDLDKNRMMDVGYFHGCDAIRGYFRDPNST